MGFDLFFAYYGLSIGFAVKTGPLLADRAKKAFCFMQKVSGPKAICFGQIDFLPFCKRLV